MTFFFKLKALSITPPDFLILLIAKVAFFPVSNFCQGDPIIKIR